MRRRHGKAGGGAWKGKWHRSKKKQQQRTRGGCQQNKMWTMNTDKPLPQREREREGGRKGERERKRENVGERETEREGEGEG